VFEGEIKSKVVQGLLLSYDRYKSHQTLENNFSCSLNLPAITQNAFAYERLYEFSMFVLECGIHR
jgi:hypothetical protein